MSILLTLAVALTALEDPKPTGVDRTSIAKFQGRWALHKSEHGGKTLPAKEVAAVSLEVAGVQMIVRENGETKEESALTLLEAKGKPATLDTKITSGPDKDKMVRGIWKLEGDLLTICVAEPGKNRPEQFSGKEGTGHTLLVFERQKKK